MKDFRKLFASKDFKGDYSNKSCCFGCFVSTHPSSPSRERLHLFASSCVCVCTSSSLNYDIIFTAAVAISVLLCRRTGGCLDPVMSYLLFTRVFLDTFALQIYF